MAPEIFRFFGIGKTKIIWRATWRNALGLIAGLLIGGQVAQVLNLSGLPLVLVVACWALVGLWLTTERHGILRVRRLGLVVGLRLRQLRGASELDPAGWYASPPPLSPVIRRRTWDGQRLLDARPFDSSRNGTG